MTVRSSMATTLEALELTNGAELTGRLSRGAELVLAHSPNKAARPLMEDVYLSALGRRPTRVEAGLAKPLLGKPVRKEGVEDLLWAITMLPEFQLIY